VRDTVLYLVDLFLYKNLISSLIRVVWILFFVLYATGDVIVVFYVRIVWNNIFGETLSMNENIRIAFQYLNL